MDDEVIQFEVTIELDDDGYWDRLCPSENCGQEFKVHYEDWKYLVPDARAYCPFCGHAPEPSDFNTPEQSEYILNSVIFEARRLVGNMLSNFTQDINRSSRRNDFIQISASYKPSHLPLPLRPSADAAMTLKISCEKCGCRYAVVGAGFFCPACGDNSAELTFDQSMQKIKTTFGLVPTIRSGISDRDAAAQVERALVEGQMGSVVGSFQRLAESLYERLPGYLKPPKRNVFQRVRDGSDLWVAAGGRPYSDHISEPEMKLLIRLFQKRHLLSHTEGIVDQDYIDRSEDLSFRLGQRIVVRPDDVVRAVEVVTHLAEGLRYDVSVVDAASGSS